MTSMPSKHQRIKDACQELEYAIMNFDNEPEARLRSESRAKKEAEKLKEIKLQLSRIKQQLDDLSN